MKTVVTKTECFSKVVEKTKEKLVRKPTAMIDDVQEFPAITYCLQFLVFPECAKRRTLLGSQDPRLLGGGCVMV